MDCSVCGSVNVLPFDKITSIEGTIADLACCTDCGAILNLAAYAALKEQDAKSVQRTDFYLPSSEEVVSASAKVEECAALFDYLQNITALPTNAVFCDFGAGRGYVALYASRLFRKSIACEWDTRSIDAVKSALPEIPRNFEVVADIDAVPEPIGLLFMWHSLEHLPMPTTFWKSREHALDRDAIIYLQVPLFRPAHVVDCHYVFYTERSLSRWAKEIGASPLNFGYDVQNGFLGMIAKRGA
ncbi:MAG: hypothetical protein ACOY4R_31600 [Pseudomonadota bacterium]